MIVWKFNSVEIKMKFEATYFGQSRNSWANQILVEGHNNSQLLQVSLDDGFTNKSSTEESPKRDQKVAASDTSQIEQRVRNLQGENGIFKNFRESCNVIDCTQY